MNKELSRVLNYTTLEIACTVWDSTKKEPIGNYDSVLETSRKLGVAVHIIRSSLGRNKHSNFWSPMLKLQVAVRVKKKTDEKQEKNREVMLKSSVPS